MMREELLRFIAFEGSEGAGKSTQIRRLETRLLSLGEPVLTIREPGSTPLGECLRRLLKESSPELAIAPESELFLFLASRAQVVRQAVQPALAKNSWILSDRFSDSTLAYQGGGRGFSPALLRSLNDIACAGLSPKLTFVLDLSLPEALARIAQRKRESGQGDRIEEETAEFFERVRSAYGDLARLEPERVRLIDASRSVDEVAADIWEIVSCVFGL
ncbi:dTMP kinase [Verrucomicrobium sp. 3C]|uniref:dTMP kinase n=1 Tax=Verrucomicrobium sp. 3C TaxID=1134055 RepID=UPI0018CBD628|nr:dTMP kinase [Verrucomicrobium sp. 3C]